MTDNDDHDDEGREFFRRLLDTTDDPPRDVVKGSGPTREVLLGLNDLAGAPTEVSNPGEITPDGVEAATVESAYVDGPVVAPADLARAGLTPDDVPNLRVLYPNPGDDDE